MDFSSIFTKSQLKHLPTSLEFEQGKHSTFYFIERFRCFRLNKSVLETVETKQADSQLHFAPKIIKIHLTVLENESFEVYMLFQKSIKNDHAHETPSCMYVY